MYVRKTPKGKWRFAEGYTDPLTGKWREVSITLPKNTATARKEANAYLQQKIRDKAAPDPSNIRLSQLIEKFVAHQYSRHKASTAKQDEMHLRTVERLIGPDAIVSRITGQIITNALESAGKSNTWKNQKLRHIKLLWGWAYRSGYIDSLEAVDRVERWPEESARQKVIGKYMEGDELKAVLADICQTDTGYGLLTKVLALTGMRIGEAIALTVADIDFERNLITVDKTYAINTGGVQSTKTETSDRAVFMRPELVEVMRTAVARQKQVQLSNGFRTDILFPWHDGGYLHYEAYSKFFRYHTKKVLGRALPVHSLRHTFTSLMCEAGVPIETISRQLGHSDSKITREIYMHVTEKVRKADNEKLAAVKIL